jgi:3',5'-cyclic AMP phosphodiesterase CpdA
MEVRMEFRLLHISDIHLGPHVRCGGDLFSAAYQLAHEIGSDLGDLQLLPVQAVAASGDFTYCADLQEFEAVHRFFETLSTKINLPLTNFVFVPGNHDMAWFPPARLNQPRVPNLRSDAKAGYGLFLRRVRGLAPTTIPPCNADIVLFAEMNPPVAIVGLNSARFEDQRTAGLGYVGEGQILELLRDILERGVDSGWRKIAVLHHHLVPVMDISLSELLKPREERKVSMTVDAATVLNLLLADGFDMVLHGHMHTPFCAIERREAMLPNFPRVSTGEIVIHGAGTVGMDDSEGDAVNHYSVIEFSRNTVEISSVTRPIGESAREKPADKRRTTVQLSRRVPHTPLLELPSTAHVKHMRIREDARETWLDMYALMAGHSGFEARFKEQVHRTLASMGEDTTEPGFSAIFETVAGQFTRDSLAQHEQELESKQLFFLQYFLWLFRKSKLGA